MTTSIKTKITAAIVLLGSMFGAAAQAGTCHLYQDDGNKITISSQSLVDISPRGELLNRYHKVADLNDRIDNAGVAYSVSRYESDLDNHTVSVKFYSNEIDVLYMSKDSSGVETHTILSTRCDK